MDANEIVMHVKQRERVCLVLDLLTERVRQAREAAHVHPHVQILPFNVARADVFRIGFTPTMSSCVQPMHFAGL
jgi:hypothetical protein